MLQWEIIDADELPDKESGESGDDSVESETDPERSGGNSGPEDASM